VANAAVAVQSLIGQFGHMRSAYHNRDASSTKGIRSAVRARNHSGHGTDTDQIDALIPHELDKLRIVHRFRVAIQQNDFMRWRRSRLEQEHPQMWHEVAGDSIVRIVKKNFHIYGFRMWTHSSRGSTSVQGSRFSGRVFA
jgi:hypothetical protein